MERKIKNKKVATRIRRKKHIRKNIFGDSKKPRLSVYRTNLHIYAQLIDDEKGVTLVATGTNSKEAEELLKAKTDATDGDKKKKKKNKALVGKVRESFIIGKLVAKKALEQGIKEVVYDRNGYLYHGRVKALADGVRASGITI